MTAPIHPSINPSIHPSLCRRYCSASLPFPSLPPPISLPRHHTSTLVTAFHHQPPRQPPSVECNSLSRHATTIPTASGSVAQPLPRPARFQIRAIMAPSTGKSSFVYLIAIAYIAHRTPIPLLSPGGIGFLSLLPYHSELVWPAAASTSTAAAFLLVCIPDDHAHLASAACTRGQYNTKPQHHQSFKSFRSLSPAELRGLS